MGKTSSEFFRLQLKRTLDLLTAISETHISHVFVVYISTFYSDFIFQSFQQLKVRKNRQACLKDKRKPFLANYKEILLYKSDGTYVNFQ